MNKPQSKLKNLTKAYTLTSLLNEPAHGYKLIQNHEVLFEEKISAGQIYPILTSMEKQGLVTHTVNMQGRRKRKVFELTETGKTECLRLQEQVKKIFHLGD